VRGRVSAPSRDRNVEFHGGLPVGLCARTSKQGAFALDISGVLFVLLAAGVLGGGLAVVTLRNVIHSAIAMMICFGSLAGMYALLGAPIVAAAQVLIYIGAISVLILFAIMLTQAGDANLPAPFHPQVWFAAVAALAVVGLVGWAVVQTDWGTAAEALRADVDDIAVALFTDYALPFEVISLLLLAAIIGAIFLARRPEADERAN
jgi:NADH:ubiquinone oxidoreductase subunit 6 (subunit J)